MVLPNKESSEKYDSKTHKYVFAVKKTAVPLILKRWLLDSYELIF